MHGSTGGDWKRPGGPLLGVAVLHGLAFEQRRESVAVRGELDRTLVGVHSSPGTDTDRVLGDGGWSELVVRRSSAVAPLAGSV
jgi:hypothetical protein